MNELIYVDHAATSPMHPDVVTTMLPYFQTVYGNPSSVHSHGRKAREAMDEARTTVANLLNTDEQSIIFTSGGTEAVNLAIIGYAMKHAHKGNHIVTSQIEHQAVLHACAELERRGFRITYVPVDRNGQVRVEDVEEALCDDTILVSIMYGNNEVGTIQPIEEIGTIVQSYGICFHTDAVQACGEVPINVSTLPVDLLSASGHKINGPKGVGFLYMNKNISLHPLFFGGDQERKRRAGTENVAAIVGLQKALQLAIASIEERTSRYYTFTNILTDHWKKERINFCINGDETNRLPHILNVSFPTVPIESLLANLDIEGISASSGSACTAGSIQPSHVLSAMFGEESKRVTSSVRFSFGLGNNEEEMKLVAKKVVRIVERIEQKQHFI